MKKYRDKATLEELYHEEGMTQYEIADTFGVSQTTIKNWMQKHDIEARGFTGLPSFYTNPRGYELSGDSVSDSVVRVHRLVAVAEYGFDAVAGKDVHHKNGIPWDNRPENVQPLSANEHQRVHGKLTESDVKTIKRRYASEEVSQRDLAIEYGVDQALISRIIRGEKWSWVE